MSVYLDSSSNFHPYECDGPGKCPHCDRRVVVTGPNNERTGYEPDPLMVGWVRHDPATCALCDPAYDHQPNPHRKGSAP